MESSKSKYCSICYLNSKRMGVPYDGSCKSPTSHRLGLPDVVLSQELELPLTPVLPCTPVLEKPKIPLPLMSSRDRNLTLTKKHRDEFASIYSSGMYKRGTSMVLQGERDNNCTPQQDKREHVPASEFPKLNPRRNSFRSLKQGSRGREGRRSQSAARTTGRCPDNGPPDNSPQDNGPPNLTREIGRTIRRTNSTPRRQRKSMTRRCLVSESSTNTSCQSSLARGEKLKPQQNCQSRATSSASRPSTCYISPSEFEAPHSFLFPKDNDEQRYLQLRGYNPNFCLKEPVAPITGCSAVPASLPVPPGCLPHANAANTRILYSNCDQKLQQTKAFGFPLGNRKMFKEQESCHYAVTNLMAPDKFQSLCRAKSSTNIFNIEQKVRTQRPKRVRSKSCGPKPEFSQVLEQILLEEVKKNKAKEIHRSTSEKCPNNMKVNPISKSKSITDIQRKMVKKSTSNFQSSVSEESSSSVRECSCKCHTEYTETRHGLNVESKQCKQSNYEENIMKRNPKRRSLSKSAMKFLTRCIYKHKSSTTVEEITEL